MSKKSDPSRAVTSIQRLIPSAVLELLGRQYPSNAMVIEQYVENGRDAGARRIWIVLEPGRITVTDDGHGMTRDMSSDSRGWYECVLDEIGLRRSVSHDDFLAGIDDLSLASLEWLMESVGLSGKTKEGFDPGARGTKGVGAVAFRQIAEHAIWRTKPSIDMFGVETGGKVYCLIPPTNEEIRAHVMTYIREETSEILTDPFGRELDHGTMVKMTGVSESAARTLRPAQLRDHLSRSFGAEINSRRLDITIVDRVTEEGKRYPKGLESNVPALVLMGFPIVDKELTIRMNSRRQPHERASFRIEIYWSPKGKVGGLTLRRRGADIRRLADLEEFAQAPWDSGKLCGYVSFPDVPDSIAPWTPDKRLPLPGDIRDKWVREVHRLEEEIEERILYLENEQKNRLDQAFADDLAGATFDAIREVQSFSSALLGTPLPARNKRQSKTKGPPARNVVVQCFDEHHQGVAGVSVQLSETSGKVLYVHTTMQSGALNFGVHEKGVYVLEVVGWPEDIRLTSRSPKCDFTITPTRPGFRQVFRFQTGWPAPEQKRVPRIQIFCHPLVDPGQPYDISNLEHGTMVLNTDHPEYRDAIDRSDDSKKIAVCAGFVAAALTEYALEGDVQYLLWQTCALNGRIFDHLRERRSKIR